MLRTFLIKSFGKNSSIVANYRIFWDDLYMHRVMFNVNVSHSGRNTLMISYGSWGMSSYHIDTVLSDIDMKARKLCLRRSFLGFRRKNMSSRYFDIFMFEMTYHVCYGNSQSIGIVAGGDWWKS